MSLIDISQWRARAREAREEARLIGDPDIFTQLMKIAEQYENLVRLAEKSLSQKTTPTGVGRARPDGGSSV
jgi:hypothetical protein